MSIQADQVVASLSEAVFQELVEVLLEWAHSLVVVMALPQLPLFNVQQLEGQENEELVHQAELGGNEELEQLGLDLNVRRHGQVHSPSPYLQGLVAIQNPPELEQVVDLNVAVDVEELIVE